MYLYIFVLAALCISRKCSDLATQQTLVCSHTQYDIQSYLFPSINTILLYHQYMTTLS